MGLSFTEMTQLLGSFWWPFVRISGFFMFVPIFGDGAVPRRVRVLLAVLLTILVVPFVEVPPAIDPFSLNAVTITIAQLIWGLLFGLTFQLLFTVFTMIGQTISMQMGLAMAVMNDPANGVNVAIVGRLYLFLCTLLFLAFDGHLVAIALMVESFTIWPIKNGLAMDSIWGIVKMMGWVFSAAFAVAIPAIAAMLIANASFGFMNKAAPSLNVFALGFPMTMVLGLFALFISMNGINTLYFDVLLEALAFTREYMQGGTI